MKTQSQYLFNPVLLKAIRLAADGFVFIRMTVKLIFDIYSLTTVRITNKIRFVLENIFLILKIKRIFDT